VLIVSSDFLRARETAELARELIGAGPIRLHPGLRERGFGAWEGRSHDNYRVVWERDAVDSEHTDQGVESAVAVQRRAVAVVHELEQAHQGQRVLLVAHGDALQILATAFAGADPGQHRSLEPWPTAGVRPLVPAGGTP
jgi:broad specificity phosphatase PhoE